MEAADFGGWATKSGLKCTDGRTIMPGAFKHMDQEQVPLVYQHMHSAIDNVLGHAILEHRDEGVYTYAFFNGTPQGQNAKLMVQHGDLKHLSIYANNLEEQGKRVTHGNIREVSLVLAGANPGAVIDNVNIKHGDGSFTSSDEDVIIYTESVLEHSSDEEVVEENPEDETEDNEELAHADDGAETVADVVETMNEKQKNALYFLVGQTMEDNSSAKHSDETTENDLTHQEGADTMSRNAFDQTVTDKQVGEEKTLSHAEIKAIFEDAAKCGSLKKATQNVALQHGIDSIDILFPDAKMATGTIDLEKRRTEWVSAVLNGTRHTPFARIKTFVADLTQDEARAKGYIKGTYKEQEWIGVTKRTTAPTTIYKKQQLDRDDMIDITDFDIVAFLKAEMRLMTEEEIARAILIGDGRSAGDNDKIKDPAGAADGIGIRSILNDHELFVTVVYVNVDDADSSYEEVVDAVMDGMEFYKGAGNPTFFTTIPQVNKFKQARDEMGRRYYANNQEVADALGVGSIVNVEPMKEVTDLIGIIVNLDDYNVGTDRGGELTMFEDFDIDYNQQKYLLETRMSGALIKPKTAIVIKKTAAGNVKVTPTKPAFDAATGVITIPTQTGIVYKDEAGTTLTAGAQTALAAGASKTVTATPASGYYVPNNQTDSWKFTRNHA
jgi:HK97 family phage prohead protease